jgi:hypothetical protein
MPIINTSRYLFPSSPFFPCLGARAAQLSYLYSTVQMHTRHTSCVRFVQLLFLFPPSPVKPEQSERAHLLNNLHLALVALRELALPQISQAAQLIYILTVNTIDILMSGSRVLDDANRPLHDDVQRAAIGHQVRAHANRHLNEAFVPFEHEAEGVWLCVEGFLWLHFLVGGNS